ncbi:cysteine desulfurase family protein [Desmospora activa]|uniref:Cysteine desulfurase n=1 Tax=Desmospora activa DSM 45169 TaxID=1121389 RepID=A0A2T4ZBS6_9BACL|nr:cysteine desulfurase family protein [Desmospora activa]PTM59360.1 cysteine desulfurase [Desmospora activa DSM 45169]
MIYLDNSATTRINPEVVRVMTDVMQNIYGNPASLHGLGGKAERLVTQARRALADTLRVSPSSLVFTSGGTESNNLAVKGAAYQFRQRGRHIVTTAVEHASVYEVMGQLKQEGWKVTVLPVDSLGRVDPQAVEEAVTEDTVLVSVMHVNNETGTIQPVQAIGERLRRYPKVLFHVDAVQAFGKVPLQPQQWGVDLMTFSAHKFHGPKGAGALYIREGVRLTPLLVGGGQEEGFRSGTLNVPGIVGLSKAAVLAEQQRLEATNRWADWKESMLEQVSETLTGMRVNGDVSRTGSAPHILSLSFPGLKSEVIVHALEEEGVIVSSKSACSSKGEKPSRILKAMGLSDEEAIGAIRISMGMDTEANDIDRVAEALKRVIPRLQQLMKVHGI